MFLQGTGKDGEWYNYVLTELHMELTNSSFFPLMYFTGYIAEMLVSSEDDSLET